MYSVKVLLIFFIVFNFPIPIVYNSAVLALLIATGIYLYKPSYTSGLRRAFKNKYIITMLAVFSGLLIMGVIPGILHFTFDFTIIKPYLLNIILFVIAIYIYPLLVGDILPSERFNIILRLLIIVFIVQSLIEVIAFVNPAVKDLVAFFQKESVSSKDMGGIRALALTGNPFFDLAAGYGLIFIVFCYSLVSRNDMGKYFTLRNASSFIFLFVGSFFAGRTAFVGLGMAFIVYFLSFGRRLQKLGSFLKLIFIVLFSSFILYELVLPDDTKEVIENQLLPFAFEAVYNYIEEGTTSTASGDVLDEMYFPLSWQTFVLGDGRYTGDDGAYYQHTDSGIMRNILFYGVFGLLFVLIGHLLYFIRPLGQIFFEMKNGISGTNINKLLFFLSLLSYTLLLQYKGEVLLFMPIIQVILLYICFSFLERSSKV